MKQIRTYITKADEALVALGYTEHSFAHVTKVARFAKELLLELGYGAERLSWPGSRDIFTISATSSIGLTTRKAAR